MSAKYTFLAWELNEDIKSGALVVLLQLANNANDDGVSWYSIEKMAAKCKMSIRAFKSNLVVLEGKGLLKTIRRPNKSSIYKLLLGSADSALPETSNDENCTPEVQILHDGSADSAPDPNNEPNKDLVNKKSIQKKSIPKKYEGLDFSPLELTDDQVLEVIKLREFKKAPVTQRVIKVTAKEFALARQAGVTNEQILDFWSQAGWVKFQYDWMRKATLGIGRARDSESPRDNFDSNHDLLGGFKHVN